MRTYRRKHFAINVLPQVDRSYYEVLNAQAVLRSAQETVKDRQLVSDQVSALASNKLRRDMDVSFASGQLPLRSSGTMHGLRSPVQPFRSPTRLSR